MYDIFTFVNPIYNESVIIFRNYIKPGKIQTIKFKQCIYKVRDSGGKSSVGIGSLLGAGIGKIVDHFKKPKADILDTKLAKEEPKKAKLDSEA